MDYKVEKDGIRFYNYYFEGVEKPIVIEARTKQEAREIMKNIRPKFSDKYRLSKVIGETVVIPLVGISEKVVKGVKYIWVGENRTHGGWLTEEAYNRAIKYSKRNS